jgi:hypothetical protein
MPVDTRPAMLLALPQVAPSRAKRDRLWRWFAAAVTAVTATVAILIVAAGAVMLGMT